MDIVQEQDEHTSSQEEGGMICNRLPMRRALVGKRATRAKHLYCRNQAKEHEDDPDHQVAFEQFTC